MARFLTLISIPYRTCPGTLLLHCFHGDFKFQISSPGLHLADASVFIVCVMALAVFDVSKCIEHGIVIEPVHDYTTGTIRYEKVYASVALLTYAQSPGSVQVQRQATI